MKRITNICMLLAVAISTVAPAAALAKEISLFDRDGDAVAYVDTDSDATIYLWGGKPVAYLDGANVYGFNGKHLGWFDEGIVWDHKGDGVGFVKGAVNKLTNLEGLKGLKELKPLKSLKDLPPLKPLTSAKFSRVPLELFLLQGAD